jgi:hypothetical protein
MIETSTTTTEEHDMQHTTRKATAHGKRETLRRREIRRIKYAAMSK